MLISSVQTDKNNPLTFLLGQSNSATVSTTFKGQASESSVDAYYVITYRLNTSSKMMLILFPPLYKLKHLLLSFAVKFIFANVFWKPNQADYDQT